MKFEIFKIMTDGRRILRNTVKNANLRINENRRRHDINKNNE